MNRCKILDEATKSKMISKSLLMQVIEEEMLAPEGQRDMALIEECFEDIDALQAPSIIRPEKVRQVKIRKLALVGCILLMTLLFSFGIVGADGVSLWRVVFTGDSESLTFNYVSRNAQRELADYEKEPDSLPAEEAGVQVLEGYTYFETPEEGAAAFTAPVHLLGDIPEGYQLDRVSIAGSLNANRLFVSYLGPDDQWIYLEATHLIGEGVVGFGLGKLTKIERLEKDGTLYRIMESEEGVWIQWMEGEDLGYLVFGQEDVETMKTLVFNMK